MGPAGPCAKAYLRMEQWCQTIDRQSTASFKIWPCVCLIQHSACMQKANVVCMPAFGGFAVPQKKDCSLQKKGVDHTIARAHALASTRSTWLATARLSTNQAHLHAAEHVDAEKQPSQESVRCVSRARVIKGGFSYTESDQERNCTNRSVANEKVNGARRSCHEVSAVFLADLCNSKEQHGHRSEDGSENTSNGGFFHRHQHNTCNGNHNAEDFARAQGFFEEHP